MGAAGLLAEGVGSPEGQGARQEAPGEPGARIHQQEVESHEREAGRGMRTRETHGPRQVVRPVLVEADVGTVAAEACEVPRAIGVGHELEAADDDRAERDRGGDIGGAQAERPQLRPPAAGKEHAERREAYDPREDRAAFVQQRLCPPGARAHPGLRTGVEEECSSDPAIEVVENDHRHHEAIGRGRECAVHEPETAAARDGRHRDRSVHVRSCASSGRGTARC